MPSVPGFIIGGGGGGTPDDNSVSTAKLVDGAVTLAKLANVASPRILGRVSSSTGVPEALTSAQARDIVGSLYTDGMAGSGWTTGSATGGATAAWTAGTLVLTAQHNVSGDISVSNPSVMPTGDNYDVYVRAAITTGDTAALASGSIVFMMGLDADNKIQAQIKSDGDIETYVVNATSYSLLTGSAASGITSGQRTGGQLWYRWSRTATGAALLWGVGSGGALPTSWTLWNSYSSSNVSKATQGTYVNLALLAGAISGGYVATVYAVRSTGHGVGPL